MSRDELANLREHVRILAMQIGLRPAARAFNLKSDRVRQWAKRFNWRISLIRPATNATLSHNVTSPINALQNVLDGYAERTRLAMARTSQRAFEHSDTVTDEMLHELPRAVALEKHARVASIAHNWSTQQVNVGVALNVPLPDETERAEMRAIDAKLDAIADRLRNAP